MGSTRILVVLALVLFSGCSVMRPGIPGSGIRHSEVRQVESFDEVDLSGFGTVEVYVGEAPSVSISTDNNLLSLVDTRVENGKLTIKTLQNIHPKTGLKIDVTVPQLTAARVRGAGDIRINNVVGERLDLSVSGAGTLNANGHVNLITTSISGAGDADLRELLAAHADVKVSGAGDVWVHATDSIKARISGAGDVICYGNPAHIDQRISGVGDLTFKPSPAPTNVASGTSGYTISD